MPWLRTVKVLGDWTTTMITKKLFLASSAELKEDRKEFEIFIGRKNSDWVTKGVFLELVIWEDFLDAVSQTRLQDEYNKAIRECDLFVMLFWTKVGQYTEEEFETAFGQFKTTNKPFIFTYFKDAEISIANANRKGLMSLLAFQEKLSSLGHFQTVYKNVADLKFQFNQQLDKLAANGFIEFDPKQGQTAAPPAVHIEATITGGTAGVAGAQNVSIGSMNIGASQPPAPAGSRGPGGNPTVICDRNIAIGGPGGPGGNSGFGGVGGGALGTGDNMIVAGGAGGAAGDNRVWRHPAKSGYEVAQKALGLPVDPMLRQYGRGGAVPGYEPKLAFIEELRRTYFERYNIQRQSIFENISAVPLTYLNNALADKNEEWRVRISDGDEYEFFVPGLR
jgi:hypothetical protein